MSLSGVASTGPHDMGTLTPSAYDGAYRATRARNARRRAAREESRRATEQRRLEAERQAETERRQRERDRRERWESMSDEEHTRLRKVHEMTILISDLDAAKGRDLDAARQAAHKAAGVLRQYRSNVADIRADGGLSEVGKDKLIHAAGETASADLDEVFTAARDGIEAAERAIAKALERPENDLRAEMVEGRAWQRYERMLSAGIDPLKVIGAASDDPAGLRALRVELPAYLASKGDDDLTGSMLEEIDRAQRPHLSSVERAALDIRDEINAAKPRLSMAENAAHTEVSGGQQAYALVTYPGDEAGNIIDPSDDQ